MATIRKRERKGGSVWQVQVRLAGHPPQSATFDDRDKAVAWARGVEGELAKKPPQSRTGYLLGEAILRYGRTVEPHKAKTTQVKRKGRMKWWYEKYGELPIRDITPSLIAEARDKLASETTRRGTIRSGATVNRYLTALSAVMRYAADDWEWIAANPVEKVRRLPESRGRVRWLTKEEISKLLEECRGESSALELLVLMAIATGMRQGELLALTWDRIDLKRRVLVLEDTKNNERRGVPISKPLLAALRAHPRRLDTPFLFPDERLGPGDDPAPEPWERFRYDFEDAVERAGISDFTFHDLRHTAASHLAMGGATPHEIADVLGHKTLAMVRRYSHLSPEHVAGVVERLSEILPDPTTPRSREAENGDE